MPKLFWGPLLLVHFLFILIYIGVLPLLYRLFRSLSIGLRRCYIRCKLVLFPKRRTYRRKRCRLRFRRFHRRRLAYHSVRKCLTWRSVHPLNLSGTFTPTLCSRRHHRCRRRNLRARKRLYKRRVVDHEFFLSGQRHQILSKDRIQLRVSTILAILIRMFLEQWNYLEV